MEISNKKISEKKSRDSLIGDYALKVSMIFTYFTLASHSFYPWHLQWEGLNALRSQNLHHYVCPSVPAGSLILNHLQLHRDQIKHGHARILLSQIQDREFKWHWHLEVYHLGISTKILFTLDFVPFQCRRELCDHLLHLKRSILHSRHLLQWPLQIHGHINDRAPDHRLQALHLDRDQRQDSVGHAVPTTRSIPRRMSTWGATWRSDGWS